MVENFKDMGLSQVLLDALEAKGFKKPSSIQEKVIPLLLAQDSDIVGQARTGTGKTAAFGLPILEKLIPSSYVQAIVLAPTRELAIQVDKELHQLKGKKALKILSVYGGQPIDRQVRSLRSSVDIVVGTPGRVLDLLKRKSLNLQKLKFFILDEADEMLNVGFIDSIEKIFDQTNDTKKSLLFSATMPPQIFKLAKRFMKEHVLIKADQTTNEVTSNLVEQSYIPVAERNKMQLLSRIIDAAGNFYGLVFCRTKRDADSVSEKLIKQGYLAEALHGNLSQSQRERVLVKFRKRICRILVVTDVASRGLDIADLTHVINYALPEDCESYVHRIGRTGRAGQSGFAISFVSPSQRRMLTRIQQTIKHDIAKKEAPTVESILAYKKQKISEKITAVVDQDINEKYLELAKSLSEEKDPMNVLAAVLKISYHSDLDESQYADISSSGSNYSDRRSGGGGDKTRLFVARGKKDKMSIRSLVSFLEEKSNVYGKRMQNIQICDKFSFVTVSSSDADAIISAFRPDDSSRRSIIAKAKAL